MNIAMTWEQMCADPVLRDLPFKIEQDRYGRIVMSPVNADHGRYQAEIALRLRTLLPRWGVFVECGVETSDGVKAPDVAAAPADQTARFRGAISLSEAPALCIEVLSPGNSAEEMNEKRALYAERGCLEFWTCGADGTMHFQEAAGGLTPMRSLLCPAFPARIELE